MRLKKAKFVAELLDLPLQRVYELTRQKIIPSIRIGNRQVRYDLDALEAWVRNGAPNEQRQEIRS